MRLPDIFQQLTNENIPDWDSLEFLNCQTAISNQHFLKFFKLRGWVEGLSHLTLNVKELKGTKLSHRFEYKATFKDELGSVELSSTIFTPER